MRYFSVFAGLLMLSTFPALAQVTVDMNALDQLKKPAPGTAGEAAPKPVPPKDNKVKNPKTRARRSGTAGFRPHSHHGQSAARLSRPAARIAGTTAAKRQTGATSAAGCSHQQAPNTAARRAANGRRHRSGSTRRVADHVWQRPG